jgi:hypothetical protein
VLIFIHSLIVTPLPATAPQQHIQRQIEQQLDVFDHPFVADERGRPVHRSLEHVAQFHPATAAAGRARIAHPHRTVAALPAARLVPPQRTAESALFISAAFIAAERGKTALLTAGSNVRNKIPPTVDEISRLLSADKSTGSSYPFRNVGRVRPYRPESIPGGCGAEYWKKSGSISVRKGFRLNQPRNLSPNFRLNAVTD